MKSSTDREKLTSILDSFREEHRFSAFVLLDMECGALLSASASTNEVPGLCSICTSKFPFAANSHSCLAQAQRTGSLPFPDSRTCWEATLSVLTLISEFCGAEGSRKVTACIKFSASSWAMFMLREVMLSLYSVE